MKKNIERLILFFVGLPIMLSSVYFFPHYHFFVLHCMLIGVVTIGIIEIYPMLKSQLAVYPLSLMLFIGLLIPFSVCLRTFHFFSSFLSKDLLLMMAFISFLVFCIEVIYSFSHPLTKSIQRMASSAFIFIYPGLPISFVSDMTQWAYASQIITIFLFMIFICDSAAWLFGTLFGKTNNGFIPASPNKSIAGFIGGVLGSLAVGLLAHYYFPLAFGKTLSGSLLLGVFTGFAAIIGDLIESIIKRSAQVKDSGVIIPGRGGIMDSIDSIVMGAPIFYFCYRFYFGGGL